MKYRDNDGLFKDLFVKTSDTLPIGTIVEYDGTEVPNGYKKVEDPNRYSTEEIKTNKTWIDNSPIYRKVIDLGALGNSTSKVEHNLGNTYKDITHLEGYLYNAANNKLGASQFENPAYFRSLTYDKTGSLKIIFNRANAVQWSDWHLQIIVEYTKTTDEVVA